MLHHTFVGRCCVRHGHRRNRRGIGAEAFHIKRQRHLRFGEQRFKSLDDDRRAGDRNEAVCHQRRGLPGAQREPGGVIQTHRQLVIHREIRIPNRTAILDILWNTILVNTRDQRLRQR